MPAVIICNLVQVALSVERSLSRTKRWSNTAVFDHHVDWRRLYQSLQNDEVEHYVEEEQEEVEEEEEEEVEDDEDEEEDANNNEKEEKDADDDE